MIITQKKYDEMVKLIEEQNDVILRQNKMLKQAQEELRQATKLIGLYEACIQNGVKIDFPNSTVKGGNTDNTGEIDFSDF